MADLAIGILHVAKDDGLGRAALHTGGLRFAVFEFAAFVLGLDLGGHQALDAETALLHDAAAAHRDIGVERQALDLAGVGVGPPIEAANFVRAIVGAVAGAHAAVVDLLVQALFAVHGGQHRADVFARCVVALLAQHGLMEHLGLGLAAFVVAVDTQPMHLALFRDFFLAHHGNVVFHLAADDTAGTASAFGQVDDHGPAMLAVGMIRISGRARLFMGPRRSWIPQIGREGHFPNQFAAFETVVVLGGGQLGPASGSADLQGVWAGVQESAGETAPWIDIAAHGLPIFGAALFAAIPQGHGEGAVVLTRLHHHGERQFG